MAGAYELTWLACDLASGRVAEELPSLASGQLSRRLGAVTSSQMNLHLGDITADWESATDPGRTLLTAVDTQTGLPVWAGITLTREGGSEDTIQLGACSPEGYLDRRYPGTYTAAGTDAATVMADLAAPAASTGLPLLYDVTASGLLIDYDMADTDDKSILSALQTITAMAGAPEWTVDTVWADAAQTQVQQVLRIRPAIGVVTGSPESVFDLPGCVAKYRLSESYEQGKGATVVVAAGEGEGDTRITSDVQTADDLIAAGWIRWIHRYSPSTGITSVDQLNAHAAATLALLRSGARAWTVDAVASAAPRLGTDWALGDSVRLLVESSPRHPLGAELVARAYGWDLDVAANRISPILLEHT